MIPNTIEDPVLVYTDGSAKPNPGAGSFATIIMYDGFSYINSKGYPESKKVTNNQMELLGALTALNILKSHRINPYRTIKMVTDSKYLQLGITKWIEGWIKNNWVTAAGNPVQNKELWMELDKSCKEFKNLYWSWTKGHSDDKYNNIVDRVAKMAREESK